MYLRSIGFGVCVPLIACGTNAATLSPESGSPDASSHEAGSFDARTEPAADASMLSHADGAAQDDAGGATEEDDSATGGVGPYHGLVDFDVFDQGVDTDGGQIYDYYYYYFLARFGPQADVGTELSCAPGAVVSGSCCYMAPPIADAGGAPPMVSAGVITTTVLPAQSATSSSSMTAYGPNGYDAGVPLALTWQPGDTLRVSASGATIPAFTDSIVSPRGRLISVANMSAPISADWRIEWLSLTSSSTVVVNVFNAARAQVIKCVLPDSGAVTIPASFMSHFQANDVGTLEISRVLVNTVTLSNATVDVTASTGDVLSVQFVP